MRFLACFVIFVTFIQFINSLINALLSEKLRPSSDEKSFSHNEKVSILIPARNEEAHIGNLLSDIDKLTYKNVEVIVYDDESTDRTAEIVNDFALHNHRIQLLSSEKLPDGWLGKNYACHVLSSHARGDYFLFVDADVRLKNSVIEDSIDFANKYQTALLSVFPKQIMITRGEKKSVPIMNYILLTLLPLVFVRKSPFSSHSAANGQFMFFRASVYRKYDLHRLFGNSPVEDIAISRYLKKKHEKIACLVGDKRIQCRMYANYEEALNGFSKNVRMFFGNSTFLAFIFWFVTTLGFIPVVTSHFNFVVIVLYFILYLATKVLVSLVSRQSVVDNLKYIFWQQLFLIQVIIKSISSSHSKNLLWKDRKIYS
jgi:glycosyltransferase involved in cell wall biosynthesis